ncbi:MAG: DUF4166 domain-containing protein [Chloroflexota bacterium]
MTEKPLFAQILDKKFETLQEPVKTHLGLTPNDENYILLEGHMTKIWHPAWFTIPLWVTSQFGILFPETGTDIPAKVTVEAQGLRQQWHRTFHFPKRRRNFSDAMVYNPETGETLNYFGKNDRFAMVFHFTTLPNGGLEIIGGQQYIRLGRKHVAAPRILTPAIITREWPVSGQEIQVDFTMSHPLFGEMYTYKGRFTVLKVSNLS